MEIEICEKIKIHNPTEQIKQWCMENLILDNPDFYKLERLGKWTGSTPKKIYLYETVGNELWLPFGCLRDVWKMYPYADAYTIRIKPIEQKKCSSSIILYPYQKKAVESVLQRKNGVLVMPCGAGKTQVGIEIISRVGGRALWLTHTQDLLRQSKARAESVLDIGDGTYGTITAGKVSIGTNVTFATVQTLSKIDLSAYRDMWDIIIVDECQHCCGSPTRVTQFYKVISSLSARYKIGLTATPRRADGLEKSMFLLLGGIIHEVKREEIDTVCPVVVQQIQTGWYPGDEILNPDGTIDYMAVVNSLTHDKNRFEFISEHIEKCEGATMVLANRVEYLQRLCEKSSKRAICISGASQSKKAKQERKEALQQLNNSKIDIIFATYQLAKEGLDVPNLRYVVFATPEKDSTTVIQSVGRVGRKAEGKKCGVVIDFVDDFGMYKGWAARRKGYYKKINAEVT